MERKLLPLTNSAFRPGEALKVLQDVEDSEEREFGYAEYYYFTGQPEKAIELMKPYLESEDLYLRFPACFIYSYASLSVDNLQNSYDVLIKISEDVKKIKDRDDVPDSLKNLATFVAGSTTALLYVPGGGLESEPLDLNALPEGLRSFACYVAAHYTYIKGDYAGSLGIVRTAMAFQPEIYNIPTIYLHVISVMDYIALKDTEKAQEEMRLALELAAPDGFFEAFGEHHAHLGGLVEAMVKKEHSEDFKRIIDITCNFANGWRKMHSKIAGDELVDNLTSTEFSVGMLAARGWSNQEIAEQMDISINTVKFHISSIFDKLGITNRNELKNLLYW